MDINFKDSGGKRVGFIIGNDIKDTGGNRVGFINGNDIKDSGGNRIGFLSGNDFKDTYGNRVGFISGNDIKDTHGNRVGYAEGNASGIEMCAAGLLLFNLEYDSGSGRASNYSNNTSGEKESHGLWFFLGLLLFAFWHYIKGPFVAFSLIKETSARKEWWGTCMRSLLLGFLFIMIAVVAGGDIGAIIGCVFLVGFTLLPIVVVSIRRMHDIGKSWWWILIPLVNFVMCGFFPGK